MREGMYNRFLGHNPGIFAIRKTYKREIPGRYLSGNFAFHINYKVINILNSYKRNLLLLVCE